MSTPTTRPTRQQLDELDALLQKMLSLPGGSPEPELPPPTESGGRPTSAPPTPNPLAASPTPPGPTLPMNPAATSLPPQSVGTLPVPQVSPIAQGQPMGLEGAATGGTIVPPESGTAGYVNRPTPQASVPVSPPPVPHSPFTPPTLNPPRVSEPITGTASTPTPTVPAPPPTPSVGQPSVRRAAPPTGPHLWNVPLPANAGGAAFPTWPTGVESLTSAATSTVVHHPTPPPAPTSASGKLNVSPTSAPEPPAASANPRPVSPPTNGVAAQHGIPPITVHPVPPLIPEPTLPFYLWPFGLIDRMCGSILAAFGPPGRWLGQGGGKVLIGWTGLLMLVGAAAWGLMDYLGMSW